MSHKRCTRTAKPSKQALHQDSKTIDTNTEKLPLQLHPNQIILKRRKTRGAG